MKPIGRPRIKKTQAPSRLRSVRTIDRRSNRGQRHIRCDPGVDRYFAAHNRRILATTCGSSRPRSKPDRAKPLISVDSTVEGIVYCSPVVRSAGRFRKMFFGKMAPRKEVTPLAGAGRPASSSLRELRMGPYFRTYPHIPFTRTC